MEVYLWLTLVGDAHLEWTRVEGAPNRKYTISSITMGSRRFLF